MAEKNLATEKTEIEEIQQKVTDDIINDVNDNYDIPSPPPLPQTNEKIDKERIQESKDYLQIQLQIMSRNFETIENIDEENKKELIKPIVDPSDR